ncbi:CDGSH-type Zn-finger protein [Clavibacter michiganensis]|uniref:CDGSH iron-sulfur domain-containing protein n=1 Tax=Clavibacter michiganensis TaxID=28447 RepID=UPI0019570F79|nr:CDGSH iron-sulfur domain-containing protein [Clavibacter michiganensis]MBM7410444.1 CDGSH-type Zn-finger protein [Clavibacter michiganensis]
MSAPSADDAPASGQAPARSTAPEPARIIAYPDGPLLVRGDFEIVDPEGRPVPRSRSTVALCRCGVSSIKPYCDGTHRLVGFRTDPPAPAAD